MSAVRLFSAPLAISFGFALPKRHQNLPFSVILEIETALSISPTPARLLEKAAFAEPLVPCNHPMLVDVISQSMSV